MIDATSTRTRRLDRMVVAVAMTEAHLGRLRERFPDVAIIGTADPLSADLIADADAVVSSRFGPDLLAAAPRLQWLQIGGAGAEHLPLRELAERGVVVTNLSGVHAVNISEHVLAMMLSFARDLPRLIRAQARQEWRDDATLTHVFELHGQTLLLVGVGDIGLAVAERARALGMRVIGARRRSHFPVPSSVEEVVPMERLGEALGGADHVVISLPLTAETRGLFNAERLAAMRAGSYLYNVGRGAVVETGALINALASGHLGGAGLDVTDPEPLPTDSPLWRMENVLITAHTSGGTPRYWDRGVEIIEANVGRFRDGQPLLNRVDPAAGY